MALAEHAGTRPHRSCSERTAGESAKATVAYDAVAPSPFQPANVSSRIRRTLLQFDALVADEAWDEAIELVETLQTEAGDQLTKADREASPASEADGHARFTPLASRCEDLLASLPEAGLAAYRDRVDRTARKRLDAALAELDESAAAAVAHELSASSSAGEATLAAAELALERGDDAATRRRLHRLHPLLIDPLGRPAGVALADVPEEIDPSRLGSAWLEAHGADASEADDELLPVGLARLALTSIREGDLRRARGEVRLLEALTPGAEGRLAGRNQPLADALASLIAEASSPRDLESAPRYGAFEWAWSQATPLASLPAAPNTRPQLIQNAFGVRQLIQAPVQIAVSAPSVRPVVAGLEAFYLERGSTKRLDLTTGEAALFSLPGIARPDEPARPGPQLGDLAGRPQAIQRRVFGANVVVGPNGVRRVVSNTPTTRDTALAVAGDLVFAQVVRARGRVVGRRGPVGTEQTLVGFDPRQPNETRVKLTTGPDPENPTAKAWQFAGDPIVRGDRLYVPMTTPGVRVDVALACYSTLTARELWRTELGATAASNRFGGGATPEAILAGDTIYLATEMGATAALDAATGRVRWLVQYPRSSSAAQPANRLSLASPAAGRCVVVGDRVIAAPSDSDRLFAWDAGTGRRLWEAPRPEGSTITGVVPSFDGAVVVLAGRQITTHDSLTGARRMTWPESPNAGLRGVGDAALAGGELFWPTRDTLYGIDPVGGGFTRPPIDLRPLTTAGANVTATDYGLLVCGPKAMRLLASVQIAKNPERREPVSRLMGRDSRELASSKVQEGNRR